MIKFFRQIRQQLLMENKSGKYLKYAIGEILLVMVGILLALQVNNWNELQKESTLEKEYLKGIRQDLQQDINQASLVIIPKIHKLNIIKFLEPNFNLDSIYITKNIDTVNINFIELFHRGDSFRSTMSSYNSLIADGKSNLIKNKNLFQKIQRIYDEQYLRIYSLYDDFKLRENSLSTTYPYEKLHWDFQTIQNSGHEEIIASLANFWELGHFYCTYLDKSILEVKSLINEIDVEIEK